MKRKLSVVITTIGEKKLFDLLENLKESTIIPNEIIVSIPEVYYYKIKNKLNNHIIINKSKFQNQVIQRIEGFKIAKFDYVLQLDCDVILDINCIDRLINVFKMKGDKISVSPNFFYNFNKNIYKDTIREIFQFILCYIFNEYNKNSKVFKINDWSTWFSKPYKLNHLQKIKYHFGGCVLHHKSNLIFENYYKFNFSKAFDEDIIHSILMLKKGLILYNEPMAKIYDNSIVLETYYNNLSSLNYYLKCIYRTKKYIKKITNGNTFKFYCWYLFYFIICYVNLFFKKIKKINYKLS